jgi:hypothetical protein
MRTVWAGLAAVTAPLLGIAFGFHLVMAAPRAAQHRSGEHAAECVHWRVFNNGGAGPLVRWLVCGTGSQGESPARDDTNWQTIIVDGDALRPVGGCGKSWLNPCVLQWPNSPEGVKAAT